MKMVCCFDQTGARKSRMTAPDLGDLVHAMQEFIRRKNIAEFRKPNPAGAMVIPAVVVRPHGIFEGLALRYAPLLLRLSSRTLRSPVSMVWLVVPSSANER